MADDELRRAYAALRAQRGAQPGDDRPDGETLRAALAGELPPDERERVLDVALRSGAADDMALLHTFTSAAQATARSAGSDRAGARWRTSRWTPIAAAAAVCLMAGGSFWLRGAWSDAGAGTNDDTSAGRFRDARTVSVSLIAPASSGVVTDTSMRFIWHAVSGATSYDIEVFDTDGTLLFTRTVTDTVAPLPPDLDAAARARIGAWWITTTLPDGRRLRSELRLLRAPAQP